MRHFIASSIVATLAGMHGCTSALNEQVELVDSEPLPALSDEESGEYVDDPPSLTDGLDRSHWETVTITVPSHQVENITTYASSLEMTDQTARQRGEFPTAESALEGAGQDSPLAMEAAGNLAYGFVQVAWAPIQMWLKDQGWFDEHRSPSDPYERSSTLPADNIPEWILDTPAGGSGAGMDSDEAPASSETSDPDTETDG